MQTDHHKAKQEILTLSQRFGEIITVVASLMLFAFLLYHQLADTGFYTDEFGGVEQICLYAPLLFSLVAPLTRAAKGRRNPARPWEAVGNLLLALGSGWLLRVFPFDYTHLADALPSGLRFILSWVTDDIAKIVFVLQIIIASISALVITWKYLSFRYQNPQPYPQHHTAQ
jgi:hypothetical protein